MTPDASARLGLRPGAGGSAAGTGLLAALLIGTGLVLVWVGLSRGPTLLLAVVGAGILLALWERPRLAAALVLALGVSVLPGDLHYVHLGPVQSDAVEVLCFLLMARAGLGFLGRRSHRTLPLRSGMVLLGVASVVGSVMAYRHGADSREALRWLRLFLLYLLPLSLVGLFDTRARVEALRSFVLGLATVSCVVVVAASALGVSVSAEQATSTVITLGQASSVDRVRPAVLPLLFLAVLLLLARATVHGWTVARGLQLALFVVVETLSFNRSSWAPLVLAVLAYFALAPAGRRQRARLAAIVLPLVAAAVLAVTAAALSGQLGREPHALAVRATSVLNGRVGAESSYQDRLREDRAAATTIGRTWLLGNGIGRPYGAQDVLPDLSTGGTTVVQATFIHNSYLGVVLDLGLLGALAFASLSVSVTRLVTRGVRHRDPRVGCQQLATGLGLLALAASSYLQTNLHDRPAILVWGVALTLLVGTERAYADGPGGRTRLLGDATGRRTNTPAAPGVVRVLCAREAA